MVGQKSSKFLATELLNGPLGLRINNKNWKGPIDAKDFLNVSKSLNVSVYLKFLIVRRVGGSKQKAAIEPFDFLGIVGNCF